MNINATEEQTLNVPVCMQAECHISAAKFCHVELCKKSLMEVKLTTQIPGSVGWLEKK